MQMLAQTWSASLCRASVRLWPATKSASSSSKTGALGRLGTAFVAGQTCLGRQGVCVLACSGVQQGASKAICRLQLMGMYVFLTFKPI